MNISDMSLGGYLNDWITITSMAQLEPFFNKTVEVDTWCGIETLTVIPYGGEIQLRDSNNAVQHRIIARMFEDRDGELIIRELS